MSREFIHSLPPHGRRDGENATYHHLQVKRVDPKRMVYNYWGHIQEGGPEVSILGSATAGGVLWYCQVMRGKELLP